MPDIDAEATGILIEDDCDPLTAVAGSIIKDPQTQQPGRKASRSWLIAGAILGVVFHLSYDRGCGNELARAATNRDAARRVKVRRVIRPPKPS